MPSPSQRDEYKDLLGMVPDEEIAEAAGVQVATVARWRRDLGIEPYASSGAPSALATEPAAPEAETSAPEAKTIQPMASAPKTVRCKVGTRVVGPDGRTLHLAFRGVYRAELAAWLWEHHRDLVEPFPPKG